MILLRRHRAAEVALVHRDGRGRPVQERDGEPGELAPDEHPEDLQAGTEGQLTDLDQVDQSAPHARADAEVVLGDRPLGLDGDLDRRAVLVQEPVASLTEPLAVALHAVNRGALGDDDVPIVIGCGPIGLAVISVLKMRGIGPVIAADSSPARRALAAELGADIVVDPRETSPYDSWREVAAVSDPARFGRQTALFPTLPFRPSVVFECVGVPGVIQQVLVAPPPAPG